MKPKKDDKRKSSISINQLAENVVGNIQIGIYIYHLENLKNDKSLRMIYANKASADYTGIPTKKVIGKTLDENFPGLRKKGIPKKYAKVVRSKKSIEFEDIHYSDARIKESWFSIKAFPLPRNCVGVSFENITDKKNALVAKEELIKVLRETLEEVKELRRIIPICSFCKKARNDKGYWEQVDIYLEKQFKADVSHSICPDCLEEHYPQYKRKSK